MVRYHGNPPATPSHSLLFTSAHSRLHLHPYLPLPFIPTPSHSHPHHPRHNTTYHTHTLPLPSKPSSFLTCTINQEKRTAMNGCLDFPTVQVKGWRMFPGRRPGNPILLPFYSLLPSPYQTTYLWPQHGVSWWLQSDLRVKRTG